MQGQFGAVGAGVLADDGLCHSSQASSKQAPLGKAALAERVWWEGRLYDMGAPGGLPTCRPAPAAFCHLLRALVPERRGDTLFCHRQVRAGGLPAAAWLPPPPAALCLRHSACKCALGSGCLLCGSRLGLSGAASRAAPGLLYSYGLPGAPLWQASL